MGVYRNNNNNLELIAGGPIAQYAPIGAITPFGGTLIPNGWLLCDGRAVSRTEYKVLFDVIGTAFGVGDGSTTFNVPDLRETAPVGSGTRGNGVTDHDTYTVGQFKDDQKQTHTHTISHTHTRGTMEITGSLTNYNATNAASGYYDASGAFVHNSITGSYAHSPIPSGDVNVLGIDFIASRNWTGSTSEPSNTNSGNDTGRTGTTTHGKQLGVNFIIKAKIVSKETDAEVEGEKYSTGERWTGKYWINDKPIYRKVIHYTGIITSGNSTVIGNVPAIADVVTFQGTFKNNADNNCFPLGYTYAESGSTDLVLKQNMPFVVHSNGNISGVAHGFDITDINVILEYTKTID
ncbi:MAG: tail fiber protein [Bacilli bacterium]|nr:tail fiber protein [Bacilli bacterium]MBQ3307618.1 tail fiber protein [Bacilli bacterium]MBQ3421802.1 tail fiber protein [Romboutsia sp.]